MIKGKQRSYLKSLAHKLEPIVYIGRAGITGTVEKSLNECLAARELVKCKIQEGSDISPKEAASTLAEKLDAEFVQAIGRKFVLYRPAKDKDKRKIYLPR